MNIQVMGKEVTLDEKVLQEKWKIVLDCMDFYSDDVKKFAAIYSEIYSIRLSKNVLDVKNLLSINLLTLSKIDLEDGMSIEYSDDPLIVSEYIIPIIINKNEIDMENSNSFMDNITDVISDLINERLSISSEGTTIFIRDVINNIETDSDNNADNLKISVHSCFGTN